MLEGVTRNCASWWEAQLYPLQAPQHPYPSHPIVTRPAMQASDLQWACSEVATLRAQVCSTLLHTRCSQAQQQDGSCLNYASEGLAPVLQLLLTSIVAGVGQRLRMTLRKCVEQVPRRYVPAP